MKKIITSLISVLICLLLAACGNAGGTSSNYSAGTFSTSAGSGSPEDHAQTSGNADATGGQLSLNGGTYQVTFAENETAKAFCAMLPLTLSMQELNGNEKYIYLDKKLPSSPEYPGTVQAGDLMLYGDNCIVLFYKSFDTSYAYTKIGHVDAFSEAADSMDSGTITADFEKAN